MAARSTFRAQRLRCERGQSLGLFVVWLTLILLILALIVNGGVLFAKRRQAQRAADAGALAAAAYLPASGSCTGPVEVAAHEYAIVRNATGGTKTCTTPYNGNANMVRVDVTIPTDLLFGGLTGLVSADVKAHAVAGLQVVHDPGTPDQYECASGAPPPGYDPGPSPPSVPCEFTTPPGEGSYECILGTPPPGYDPGPAPPPSDECGDPGELGQPPLIFASSTDTDAITIPSSNNTFHGAVASNGGYLSNGTNNNGEFLVYRCVNGTDGGPCLKLNGGAWGVRRNDISEPPRTYDDIVPMPEVDKGTVNGYSGTPTRIRARRRVGSAVVPDPSWVNCTIFPEPGKSQITIQNGDPVPPPDSVLCARDGITVQKSNATFTRIALVSSVVSWSGRNDVVSGNPALYSQYGGLLAYGDLASNSNAIFFHGSDNDWTGAFFAPNANAHVNGGGLNKATDGFVEAVKVHIPGSDSVWNGTGACIEFLGCVLPTPGYWAYTPGTPETSQPGHWVYTPGVPPSDDYDCCGLDE